MVLGNHAAVKGDSGRSAGTAVQVTAFCTTRLGRIVLRRES